MFVEQKKMHEQIKYLQQLLKNQRLQFRRLKGDDDYEEEVPEDEVVKYLV